MKRGADFVVIPEYVKPKKALLQRCQICGELKEHYPNVGRQDFSGWCIDCRKGHPSIKAANRRYEGKWNRVHIGGKRYRIPMNVYEWYIKFAKRWRELSSTCPRATSGQRRPGAL